MSDPAPALGGVYKPRRRQAPPLFRLASEHLHRLQTLYGERFAREYGPWRPVVGDVADKLLACGARGARGAGEGDDRAVYSTDSRPTSIEVPFPQTRNMSFTLRPTQFSRRFSVGQKE